MHYAPLRIKKSQTKKGSEINVHSSGSTYRSGKTAFTHAHYELSSLIQTITVGIGIPALRSPIHAPCHQHLLSTKARGLYRR